MRSYILSLLFVTSFAMDCSDLTAVYQQSSCCTGGGDTCLRAIPTCDSVDNGIVCFNGTNVIVKGLDAFEFTESAIIFKKSMIPDQHNAYDLGNAEKKIRDIYEHQS